MNKDVSFHESWKIHGQMDTFQSMVYHSAWFTDNHKRFSLCELENLQINGYELVLKNSTMYKWVGTSRHRDWLFADAPDGEHKPEDDDLVSNVIRWEHLTTTFGYKFQSIGVWQFTGIQAYSYILSYGGLLVYKQTERVQVLNIYGQMDTIGEIDIYCLLERRIYSQPQTI